MHRVAFPSMGKEYRLEHGSFEDSVIPLLSTITSSICSLEEAKGSAKIIPLVLQCLSESHDDFASDVGRHLIFTTLLCGLKPIPFDWVICNAMDALHAMPL